MLAKAHEITNRAPLAGGARSGCAAARNPEELLHPSLAIGIIVSIGARRPIAPLKFIARLHRSRAQLCAAASRKHIVGRVRPPSRAEAPIKIARMTLTIKLDGNWSSFQLANSAPPLCVTDSAIAPSARMGRISAPLPRNSNARCRVVSESVFAFLETRGAQLSFIHLKKQLLPRRVRSPQLCAMPVLRARAPEQAREDTSPSKN